MLIVAPGYRVQCDRRIYTAGEVLPVNDPALVESGFAIAVLQSSPEPEVTVEVEVSEEISADDGRLNVNTASESELMVLEYVGQAIAAKLIAGRPYRTLDEARVIGGLSEAKWDKIKHLMTTGSQG